MTISGAGSAVAQVIGDNNNVVITVGGSDLVLTKLHARKGRPRRIIQLLYADLRATTLVGRTEELAALARWRDDPAPIAVRPWPLRMDDRLSRYRQGPRPAGIMASNWLHSHCSRSATIPLASLQKDLSLPND
jgi:hypothetical protein